jgi:beta-N-acetylhexosaminidase
MLDVAGLELTDEDRELIAHPAVGGVILFARNYRDRSQLKAMTTAIAAVKEPRPLIAVDQEGGRVQRFRDGFTALPAAASFAALHQVDPAAGRRAAYAAGWIMASELGEVGVDFSFAPVLDVERGLSRVIGDRAFGRDADLVCELASAWLAGVSAAGMAACGKHFPGHGAVVADSHRELPVDGRALSDIEREDLPPFRELIRLGLQAIMPAHVVYRAVDDLPAGFSPFWLGEVLRGQLRFDGMVLSDDLDMAAATAGGGFAERAGAALRAGCDMVVICNNRAAAVEIVQALPDARDHCRDERARRMARRGTGAVDPQAIDSLHAALSPAVRLSERRAPNA